MTRRWRAAAGVAALGAIAALGWWWLHGRDARRAATGGPSPVATRGAARLRGQGLPGPRRWLAQVGLERRRIAGRVTHRGAPAAGATVRLELPRQLRRAAPAVEVTTGSDGAFDFGPQVATEFLVMASAPDRAPAGARVDLRNPTQTPPPDRLELALGDCEQTLYGRVHDHGGAIAGASVRATTSEESIAIATTSTDGGYQVCVGPGGGRMSVEADGYASVELDFGGGKRVRRDVELTPEATVTGIVLGPDDSPAAGAFVTAGPSELGPFAMQGSSGVADEEGRFSLGGLAPGRYTLAARDAGQRTADDVEAVAVVGGGEDVTLRLVAMVTVRGHVVEDGKPVAGARVAQRTGRFLRAGRSFAPYAQAVTQSDGSFVLDAVPPGTFAIAVDEYEVLEPATAEAVAPETEIVVVVAHKARVAGHVTRNGTPVAGAAVQMMGSAGSWGGWAKTGADGAYDLGGIDSGTYEIGAHSESAFARKKTITVARGQRLENVDIELDLAGEVSGVVVDQNGALVAGVAVVFEMGPGVDWGFATTEEDGSFVAGAMSGGGTYAVTVKPSRSSPTAFEPAPGTRLPSVALTDGRSRITGIRIAVQLDRKRISGVVVGTDGKPIADAKVSAFPPLKSDIMMRFTGPAAEAMTGDDGTFVLRDLLAGSYSVVARAATGVEASAHQVTAGRSNLRFQLPAAGGIDGELVGFGERARVSATTAAISLERFGARVRGNRFTLDAIPPGSYMVSAREGGRSDQAMVVVVAGKRATVKLTSQGTATVSGRAVDLVTREPLAGLDCGDSGAWAANSQGATTDARGRFKLAIPAGRPVTVHCMSPTLRFRAIGSSEVELAANTAKEIVVEVFVARRADRVLGEVGFEIRPGPPVVIYKVVPGGPAERAGVKVDDTVLRVDGVEVRTLDSSLVYRMMLDHKIGEKVELVLGRGGQEVAASVEVMERRRDR